MFHESGVGCSKPHFAISLPGSHLAVVDRPERAAPAGTSWTEATPPFLPLVRHAGGGHVPGHVPYPVPPLWGSLPSNLSLREGFGQSSEHKPPTGAKLAEGKPHEMARSGPHLWRALLLRLMGLNLKAPDHTTLSRRNPIVAVPPLTRSSRAIGQGRGEAVHETRSIPPRRDAPALRAHLRSIHHPYRKPKSQPKYHKDNPISQCPIHRRQQPHKVQQPRHRRQSKGKKKSETDSCATYAQRPLRPRPAKPDDSRQPCPPASHTSAVVADGFGSAIPASGVRCTRTLPTVTRSLGLLLLPPLVLLSFSLFRLPPLAGTLGSFPLVTFCSITRWRSFMSRRPDMIGISEGLIRPLNLLEDPL